MTHLSERIAKLFCIALLTLVGTLVVTGCSNNPRSNHTGTERQMASQKAQDEAGEATPADAARAAELRYQRLIEQMQQEGLWFASLAHVDALEQASGVTFISLRLRADAFRHTEQPAAAELTYRRLLGTPLEAAGLHGLGLLAGAREEFVNAIRHLEQAQRLTPIDALLLSDLGYALLRSGRITDARIPLMQASQLRPDNAQIQINLALYLLASQQADKAEALMEAHRLPDGTRAATRRAAASLPSSPLPLAVPAQPASPRGGAPATFAWIVPPTTAAATTPMISPASDGTPTPPSPPDDPARTLPGVLP